jgi:hypothetical protein
MSSTADTTTVSSSQFGVSPIPPVPTTPTTAAQTSTVDTPTPPKSSLPPPLPPTPPPPGTEDTPVDLPKEEKKDKVKKSEDKGKGKEELPKVLDDIPLPPVTMETDKVETDDNMDISIDTDESSQQSFQMGIEDDDDESRDTKRPYKFAWDEDVDKKSDITISSVHTSDLSLFEDLEGDSDDDLFDSDKSDVDDDDKGVDNLGIYMFNHL